MANNKCNFGQISKGDFLSETQYYQVKSVDEIMLRVVNERGFSFNIAKGIVEEGIFSANQVVETRKVTRTELIEIFSKVGDTVFTVCFNKQPKAADINDAIAEANRGKIIPIADLQKIVKNAYKGEERVLTGYLLSTENGFGRSNVIDLEADRGTNPEHDGRMRQVDHRTLNWLISKGVEYVLK